MIARVFFTSKFYSYQISKFGYLSSWVLNLFSNRKNSYLDISSMGIQVREPEFQLAYVFKHDRWIVSIASAVDNYQNPA